MSETLRFDLLANDNVSGVLDKVGRSATDTGSKFSKMGSVLAGVGKVAFLGLAAGATVAVGAGVKFAQMAVEDEQAANLLANTLRRNADATKGQISATESWITAQGIAKGVTDDDLRPALGRLVTATHDVGEAQKLASLAMDVSAGTGKSLESISTALMKAQNGQVSSLSRLGINTKLTADEQQAMARASVEASKGTITMEQALKTASSQTITMDQAVARMGETFGGAAAQHANTLQGKMDRLKLILSETAESIGTKLLPVLTTMATYFLDHVLPAITVVGERIELKVMPTLHQLGDFIQGTVVPAVQQFVSGMRSGQGAGGQFADALNAIWGVLKPVGEFIANNKTVVATFAGVVLTVAAAIKVWVAVQTALNFVLSANPIGLVVIAVAALAAGLVYAYRHSETFRNIVDTTFDVVSRSITWFWNNVGQPVLSGLVAAIGHVIGAFAEHGRGHVPRPRLRLAGRRRRQDARRSRRDQRPDGLHPEDPHEQGRLYRRPRQHVPARQGAAPARQPRGPCRPSR
jgi:hypothetical protein